MQWWAGVGGCGRVGGWVGGRVAYVLYAGGLSLSPSVPSSFSLSLSLSLASRILAGLDLHMSLFSWALACLPVWSAVGTENTPSIIDDSKPLLEWFSGLSRLDLIGAPWLGLDLDCSPRRLMCDGLFCLPRCQGGRASLSRPVLSLSLLCYAKAGELLSLALFSLSLSLLCYPLSFFGISSLSFLPLSSLFFLLSLFVLSLLYCPPLSVPVLSLSPPPSPLSPCLSG